MSFYIIIIVASQFITFGKVLIYNTLRHHCIVFVDSFTLHNIFL